MQIDGGLRGLFRERLRRGVHWQSVETGGTGRGIPDSNFCILGGLEGWIEFKQTSGWAVTLSPEQAGWHLLRWRHGGTTLIGTRRRHDGGPRKGDPVDELWLHEGRWARELRRDGLRSSDAVALGVWSGGPGRWDWEGVREALERTLESRRAAPR